LEGGSRERTQADARTDGRRGDRHLSGRDGRAASARDGGLAVPLADVRFEREDQTVLAVVTGEVDMSNAATVRLEIAEAVTPDDDALVVDLTELAFIDSAGLHSLIELGTLLDERRQQLLLCVPR